MNRLSIGLSIFFSLAFSLPKDNSRAATDASSTVSANDLEIVDFAKGSASLNEKEKTELKKVVENRRAQIALGRVHVAVWPDNPIPSSGQPALAVADRELVRKRIETLKIFLVRDLGVETISFHDMSDANDWLSRARSSSEKELSSLFAQRGAPSLSRDQVKLTRTQGGPQKAVVLFPL